MPLAIWLRYSQRIASSGGLAAFVKEAAGLTAARVQAVVWTVSYFLYLPYTVTFVVYDVLPKVFPGLTPYRASLELLLPVGIFVLVLAPAVVAFGALLGLAAVQLVLLLVLAGVTLGHVGAPSSTFTDHAGAVATGHGVGNVALLFVCASLPLFFGGEVVGGRRSVRGGLLIAYVVVAVSFLVASVPLAAVPANLRGADLPGVAIAQAYSGRSLAVAVGLASAASVVGLIVLEFLALSRLAHAVLGTALRPTIAAIGVPFIVADAVSLVNPDKFYTELLRPSLIALFVSQLIVFAVYPLFRLRARARLLPLDVALAAIACALVGYGLYTAATSSLGT